jgi:cyclophilin family peptidyl-prolyl cis-trans isomerase
MQRTLKISGLFCALLLSVACFDSSSQPSNSAPTPQAPVAKVSASPSPLPTSNPNPDLSIDQAGLSKAIVVLSTDRGVIKFRFYPKHAPNTVARLIELISQGFYNGLTFHRVEPGFVVQGGDPKGSGTGGSGKKLKAEFNNRKHVAGTLSMARTADPDSSDSQFFICLGPFPHLDAQYTTFGMVVEGLDVAKAIQKGDKMNAVWIE